MIERRYHFGPQYRDSQAGTFAAPVGVRTTTEGQTLFGYAAVFNSRSELLHASRGSFREIIAPGAFAESLAGSRDIVATFNHDPNLPLARRSTGRLSLREDSIGLRYEIRLANTTTARDLAENIRVGTIAGASFTFANARDEWTVESGTPIRTIRSLTLFELGPVLNPAYTATTAGLRGDSLPEPASMARNKNRLRLAEVS